MTPAVVSLLRQREWEFDGLGYMKFRFASINDLPIKEADRKISLETKG